MSHGMRGARFKAVLFDMDGTLLDTERVCLDAFNAVGQRYGIDDLTPTFLKIVGLSGINEAALIVPGLQGKVSLETFMPEWEALIVERLQTHVPVKADALELLTRIKATGAPMAVATSTRHANAIRHLDDSGLLTFFDQVLGGDQVTRRKPDPEPYRKVAEMLGVVASDCVIFEDSDPGTLAAVRSGGAVVQVPDLKQPSEEIRGLGHIVAPTLIDGACKVGLM